MQYRILDVQDAKNGGDVMVRLQLEPNRLDLIRGRTAMKEVYYGCKGKKWCTIGGTRIRNKHLIELLDGGHNTYCLDT